MIKLRNLLFTLAAFTSVASFADAIHVKVDGMVCSFCAQGINKKFKAEPRLEKVKVDLDAKSIELITKSDKNLTDQEITKVIEDSGFNVVSIERN